MWPTVLILWVLGLSLGEAGWIGIKIGDIENLLETLKDGLDACYMDLSQIATLCQVGDARLKVIEEVWIPELDLDNQQQDKQIAKFKNQVRDILGKTDASIADCESSLAQANTSFVSLGDLNDPLDHLDTTIEEQNTDLDELEEELDECKEDLLQQLDHTLEDLAESLDDAANTSTKVEEFAQSRHCEEGLLVISPGDTVTISYKTHFENTPDMSLNLVGMNAHLGSLNKYDIYVHRLDFDKKIKKSDAHGFTLRAEENCEGEVDLKHLYYNWLACQNLDKNAPQHPGSGGRGGG